MWFGQKHNKFNTIAAQPRQIVAMTRLSRLATFVAVMVLTLSFGAQMSAQAGDDPGYLRFGAGYYDINDDKDAGEFHFEYISGSKWWHFKPMAGVMATTDAAAYIYAGIRLDLYLGNRFVLTPQFAPGLYHDGDGKDLGHAVEFRSGLELAYRFDDRSRVGLTVYHLSNAGLDENNPGTEVLTLHYSHPLTALFSE